MEGWPQRVIVGVDGSPGAAAAVAFGRVLEEWTGADVAHAAVFGDGAAFPSLHGEAEARGALVEAGHGAGLALRAGSPARGLDEAAAGGELIVVGSSHRSRMGRVFPGSTAEHLLVDSSRAVAVVPRGFERRSDAGLRVLGVGFDGTAEAHSALRRAEQVALSARGALRVYAVLLPVTETAGAALSPAPPAATLTRALPDALAAAVRGLAPAVRALPVTLRGDSVTELLDHAEEVDALMVGARPQGRLARILGGSVGAALMTQATCPVIVVPPVPNGMP